MAFTTRRQILLAIGVAQIALFWQYILKDTLFVSLGFFRHIEPLSSFPYTCRRLTDPALHSCEDMWLNAATRTLYLACSDVTTRTHWMPNIGRLDATRRSLTDHVVALDLDSGPEYTFKTLKTTGYSNVAGESHLYLVGLTGHHTHSTGITYVYLINAQPSFNMSSSLLEATGSNLLPNAFTGANSTIEVFATSSLSDSLQHVKTFAHPQIATPNNVAYHPQSGGIYYTNDHGVYKAGIAHTLSDYIGFGDVSYCSDANPPECTKVAGGFKFPNGLHLSPTDGFLYVPSAVDGTLTVFKPVIKYPAHEHAHAHGGDGHHGHSHDAKDAPYYDGSVEEVVKLRMEYPMDNLSEDQNGDIFAAAFPNTKIMSKFDDPLGPLSPPSAALRIRRGELKVSEEGKGAFDYEIQKVLEDRDGEALPASTTVIHDAVTGRLWFSSIVADFVTVCDPK